MWATDPERELQESLRWSMASIEGSPRRYMSLELEEDITCRICL
jgi:hypothetical protein